MSKKIVIGNWKMNPVSATDAKKWFEKIASNVSRTKKTEIVICAPYIYLSELAKIRTSKVKLGAQDAFPTEAGPFTGEVSSEMLSLLGVKYVIIGHSERRTLGESNDFINKKVKGALASSLTPILCVGEDHRDENHEYVNLVRTQLRECLKGIAKNLLPKIIIAYEPVWALSSTANRRDATPADAREMAIFIRKVLSELSSPQIAKSTRVIYGGSVNERDAGDFLTDGGVDGVLPGKASLDPEKFSMIVRSAESI